jgi:hypothetical protein
MYHKTKLLTGVLLVLAVLFAQVGTALAAPAVQDTTTDTFVSLTTDPATQTVLVTYKDGNGVDQTVRLSYATAEGMGLITVDPTSGEVTVNAQVGDELMIDPTTVIPDQEEPVNPVAAILAKFFSVEPSVVQGYHEEGFGFGVIAQALWMQKNLDDDAITADIILQAKENHDYSTITLVDGSHPANWGQFRKALLDKKNNLGVIVSGHATVDETGTVTIQNNGHGNGKDNNPGKGKGKNKP